MRGFRLLLMMASAGFGGCASPDEPYCGGSYKSEAEMERALGVTRTTDSAANTVRY